MWILFKERAKYLFLSTKLRFPVQQMEGVFVFLVSVIWICDASNSPQQFPTTRQYKQYVCSESACEGQIVVFQGVCPQWTNRCEQIRELPKCRDRDKKGGTGLCDSDYKDLKLYCCTLDTQARKGEPILRFTCDNEPEASSETGTLVGGVVGSLIGGAVITGVVILMCLLCRKRRRRQESPGKQLTDTHAYIGPGHTSDSPDNIKGTNEKTSSVPDLVKTSVEPAAGEYAIISESVDVGDYTEITEDISGAAAGVSMTTASHVMTTLGGRKPEDAADNLAGQYTKLGDSLTVTDVQTTYDRLRDNNLASAHLRQTGNGSSADDNYNRLRQAAPITTTDATSGYHRLGDTAEAGSPQAKDTEAPPPDYFVLEEPADTYNKLGVAVAATEMASKDTYHRLENSDVDTGNRDPEPFETVLEKAGDSYNTIGEKTSAEEAHGTYNKLGEVTSEIRT